jgi:tetratricopeptide (TPR) repeat protein
VSLNKVGDIKAAQGDLAEALGAYQASQAIREGLAEADPSNAGWQRDLYVSYWRLAVMVEKLGQPEAALGHWRQAYKVLQGIADRGLHMTAEDLAFLDELRFKLRLADDPDGMAREFEAQLEADPDNAELYNMAQSLYHETLFDYTAAHRVTATWVARHPEDLGARCNLAETLLNTGRTVEARNALAELITHDVQADNGASILDASTQVALRLLEIAALTKLVGEKVGHKTDDGSVIALAARRAELEALLAAQPEDFTIAWSFRGTLNYLVTDQAYTKYRNTLVPLFEAAVQDRDALLEQLHQP